MPRLTDKYHRGVPADHFVGGHRFRDPAIGRLAAVAAALGAVMGVYTITTACTWTGMYNGAEVTQAFTLGTLTPNAQQQWILDNFVVPQGFATNPAGQTGPGATIPTPAAPLGPGYVLETNGLGGTTWVPGAAVVATPTGVAATDAAAIQSAINSISAAGGGTVQLQLGTYYLSSSAHAMASVTYSGGTWTVNTGTVPTVGQYIIGPGINGQSPKVATVGSGTFTTDIAPGGTVTAAALTSITPGVYLPDGVSLVGLGGATGNGASTLIAHTTLYDSGTGISVFLRGGNNVGFYAGRTKIKDLSVWGSATGRTIGSTIAGIYCANNSSFLEVAGCDISGHGQFGMGLDYNINSLDCRNTNFQYNGSATASTQQGGFIANPFNSFGANAAINFYNCWFNENNGFGVGGTNGKNAFTMWGCQWNNTNTSSAYNSGTSIFIGGSNALLSNCWSESAALYDLWVAYGNCTVLGGNFVTGGNAYGILFDYGSLQLSGVTLNGHTTGSINWGGQGSLAWSGCYCTDPIFMTGVTAAQAGGGGSAGSGTAFITPSVITPVAAVTVAANAGTVPVTSSVNNFTNSSAATMTITMAVTGAVDGQTTVVRVYDFSAVAQTMGWTNTENSTVSAPTTSAGSTTLPKTVTFQYNAATSKWRCIQAV